MRKPLRYISAISRMPRSQPLVYQHLIKKDLAPLDTKTPQIEAISVRNINSASLFCNFACLEITNLIECADALRQSTPTDH